MGVLLALATRVIDTGLADEPVSRSLLRRASHAAAAREPEEVGRARLGT